MHTSLASHIMPRTTLDLDATILADLRRRAAAEGKSMGQVASELLAGGLRAAKPTEPRPLDWARKEMGPFKIDLEDKEAVANLLDREELERGAG
jgi:plasmid stability protein